MGHFRNFLVAGVTLLWAASTSAADNSSLIDSNVQGYEAQSVELATDSAGRVVAVRVEGCELCQSQSYLPARDIRVRQGDSILKKSRYSVVSGSPGTVMFDDRDDMVFEVYYWQPRAGEEE